MLDWNVMMKDVTDGEQPEKDLNKDQHTLIKDQIKRLKESDV